MLGVEARVSALEKLTREGGGGGGGIIGDPVRVAIENKRGEVFFRPQGALTASLGSMGGLDIHIKNEDGNVCFEPASPLLISTPASSRGFWGTGNWAKALVLAGFLYYYRREVRVVGRGIVAGVRVAVERTGRIGGGREDKAEKGEEKREEDEQKEGAQKDNEEVKHNEQEETELKETEIKQQPTTAPKSPTRPSTTQSFISNPTEKAPNQSTETPAVVFCEGLAKSLERTPESNMVSTVAMRSAMEAYKKLASTQTDSLPQPRPQPEYSGFPPGSRPEVNWTPAPALAPASASASTPSMSAAMRLLSIYNEWTYPPRQKTRFETKPASTPAHVPVSSSSSSLSSSSQGYYAQPFACPPRIAPPASPTSPTLALPRQELPSEAALDIKYGDDDADTANFLREVEAEAEFEVREQKITRQVDRAAAVALACRASYEEPRWYHKCSPAERARRGMEGFSRAVEEALREGDEDRGGGGEGEESDEEGSHGDDEEDSDEDDEEYSDDKGGEDDIEVTTCTATLAASGASDDGTVSRDPMLTPESSSDSMHDDTPGFVEEHAWLDEPIVDMSDKLVFCAGWPVVGYGNVSKS
ncbi:hypothetical protein DDE82_002312 [Stemphylium lycopersici]|nr:hypothetical protein DDE82_002312 [Stemphylium lycopersici]